MTVLEQFAGRRLLFLNWRDRANPAAGGAEAYTEQVARRFARAGALVTLFTSTYPDAAPYDWANEYLVIRQGGTFGVYLAAARHLRQHRRQYDAVVDFQNGIPFFAPAWAPRQLPVVCVVHHVHQQQFNLYFRWPLNHVGRVLESRVTRRVYRDSVFVAVSPSTRAEMRHQLGLRRPIHIVPNGVDLLPASTTVRSARPAIAVVTRIVPHKQLHLLVDAVPDLLRKWPDLRVDIAGTGPGFSALEAHVRGLGLDRAVSLPGRVSEQEKSDLLARAWLTVSPSLAEGWGLTALEANTVGTPTVAYDVPGLRDSVRDGITGWLAPAGSPLAPVITRAVEELSDPARAAQIAAQCRQWAGRFTWDGTAQRLARVVQSEVMRKGQHRPSGRRPIDLAAVAAWPPEQADEVESILQKELRVTDMITRGDDGLRVLLTGCDEVGAARALSRVTVPPQVLRLATTSEVLRGSGDGGAA
jgi:glycosyltransferase involved in cell wall biosynthesis